MKDEAARQKVTASRSAAPRRPSGREQAIKLANAAHEMCPYAHALAANLLGAAATRYEASGTRLPAALDQENRALVCATRAALGDDRFRAEHRRCATLTPAEALDLAFGEEAGTAPA